MSQPYPNCVQIVPHLQKKAYGTGASIDAPGPLCQQFTSGSTNSTIPEEGRPLGAWGMIKSELVARLTQRYPHLYHRDVERIVSTVLDEITKALSEGHRVELRGFGAFSVKIRPARQGRNPRTGEPVTVEEKRAPFFRTGKELRERLNGAKQ